MGEELPFVVLKSLWEGVTIIWQGCVSVAHLIRFKRCKSTGPLPNNDLEGMLFPTPPTQSWEPQLFKVGDLVILLCNTLFIHLSERKIILHVVTCVTVLFHHQSTKTVLVFKPDENSLRRFPGMDICIWNVVLRTLVFVAAGLGTHSRARPMLCAYQGVPLWWKG